MPLERSCAERMLLWSEPASSATQRPMLVLLHCSAEAEPSAIQPGGFAVKSLSVADRQLPLYLAA